MDVCKTMLALQAWIIYTSMIDNVKQYMHGCYIYQQAKDIIALPAGEFSPLPVPDRRSIFWTFDFIIGLPIYGWFNAVMVCIDKLTKLVKLVPC